MSDMWNEMFAAPHSVDEEYDQTWPYAFKWGFDPDTDRVDVWRVQGGTDGRPTHRREIEDRWGRPPSLQRGDVMGLASYIPAEIKIDGTIVAPPEIHTQTYYDKPTPPQIVQYFQEQFPHAVVRDAIIAPWKGRVFGKTAEFEPTWKSPQSTLKWVWNEKNGLLLWQADANNLPTHNQKTLAEWNRHTSPHSEGDALGYAYSGPEKVEVESYDGQPIAPAAFAAVKSQLAEWFPNHQIIGDNQAQREFGSDPVDYRSAALTWAWENLSDDPAERSHSSSETTERRPRLLTRLFSKTVTADADMEGCMVALFVPEKAAKKLKIRRGEPVENMHITLLYFLDKIADRDDWDEVQKLVEQIANQSPPLSGTVSGYGVFNADEGDVLWASPSVQGLAELRHKIFEACEDAGFHTDTEHDWVPHITLKYDHKGKLPKGEIELDFSELSFAKGEDKSHYEFKGHLEKTTMAERSGDPELDSVLDNFQWERADWWDWSDHPDWEDEYEPQIADFENSDLSTGHCYHASEKLVSFLKQNGIAAELKTAWNRGDLPEIGYGDTPGIPPYDAHTVVVIERPSGTYMVDFTASQMGFQEHPMVQKLDDQGWQRKWSAAGKVMYHVAPAADHESIMQNGLDWERNENDWRAAYPKKFWMGDDPWDVFPPANYLWSDLNQAKKMAQSETIGRTGPFNIYQVSTDGLPLEEDNDIETVMRDESGIPHATSYFAEEPIGPERISLLNERTASNDYLDWGGWEGAHRFVTDGKEILTDPETERINDSQWRDSELEAKFHTIYPEAKSLVSGWTVPTADGMGLGIWAPAAGHGDKHEPGLHEIIGVVEKELGKPTHLITNEAHLSDEGMYDPGIETTWQTLSRKLTKPS